MGQILLSSIAFLNSAALAYVFPGWRLMNSRIWGTVKGSRCSQWISSGEDWPASFSSASLSSCVELELPSLGRHPRHAELDLHVCLPSLGRHPFSSGVASGDGWILTMNSAPRLSAKDLFGDLQGHSQSLAARVRSASRHGHRQCGATEGKTE